MMPDSEESVTICEDIVLDIIKKVCTPQKTAPKKPPKITVSHEIPTLKTIKLVSI